MKTTLLSWLKADNKFIGFLFFGMFWHLLVGNSMGADYQAYGEVGMGNWIMFALYYVLLIVYIVGTWISTKPRV